MSAPAPSLDRLSAINVDGSRRNIEPADVNGPFMRARRIVFAVLILIYVAMPFINVGGHPAMQFDIENRRFYLFGSVFNAQDVWRVVLLLTVAGAGMLFVTAWYGRIWCGWACPQTVFLEGVYRGIERFIEGGRESRIRLAAEPMSAKKFSLIAAKHGSWTLVSLLLANVFIAFFVSLPTLEQMVRQDPRRNWIAFSWVMAIASLMYFNFAWFREQMCIVLCPYGRLQSVLLDAHSIIVGYDSRRGEPRGRSTRAERQSVSLPVIKKGDCVDCGRCVTVCPNGIDIRNGTQLECIACARCVDACDDVMAKLNRPKGLIRHASLANLEGRPSRVVRPRLVIYGSLVVLALSALLVTSYFRTPFESNIVRLSGAPYIVEGDTVRNQFELHLVNKNPTETVFHVSVSSSTPTTVEIPTPDVHVASLDHYRVPIFVTARLADFHGPFDVKVDLKDDSSGQSREVVTRFLGPPNREIR